MIWTGCPQIMFTGHSLKIPHLKFLLILIFMVCSLGPAKIAYPDTSKAIIKNEIPYGEKDGGLLGRGATITALLCVESLAQEDIAIDYEVRIPTPLRPLVKNADIKIEKGGNSWILKTSFPLKVEGEKWFRPVKISIPANSPCRDYVIRSTARIHCSSGVAVIRHTTRLKVVSSKEIKDYFEIGEVIIPANGKGEPDSRREQSTFLITEKRNFWQRLVVQEDKDKKGVAPATYMAVTIKSRAAYNAILLISLDILDPRSGERVKGFEYPYAAGHGDLPGAGEIYQIVNLKPKSEEKVVLPIYTKEGVVLPGIYKARIKAFLFGTSAMVGQKDIKVKAVSTRWIPILMTFIALMTAIGGCFFFYWQRRRFLSVNSKDLILIALFGTVMFAVVNVPGTILFNVAHVLLGPFSFLLTGFFYEVIFYLLLTSLLVLIPRVGTTTLVIMVRFLMSSFVLGEFSPLSLIYYATMATVLEGAVYLSGISRGKEKFDRCRIALVALILALADTYLSFVFFNLSMLFYRLYYANWYIGVYLVVNGFLFTLLAVPFGFRLGNRLKAVSVV